MLKRVMVMIILSLMFSYIAYAGDVLWSNITDYTSTKTNRTVPISQVEPIKVITSTTGCKAYIDNATGTGVTLPANTFVDIKTPSTVSNMVFGCPSTAAPGATITVIK